jgi:hypothetical protein
MDLGQKISHSGLVSPKADKERISYPSFNLRDDVAKKFQEEYDCDMDEEYKATVTLKVSSLRKDEFGHSIGFDILSIDNVKGEEGGEHDEADEKEEKDEEEKTLGYKRQTPAKETPDMSAKTLED